MERAKRIDARLPLALLRAMQHQDTPPELMPNEPVSAFFPQRFGLSGVVEEQIRYFERLSRGRRRVDEAQVQALLELVSRRSDAGAVLESAGRELAKLHFTGPFGRLRRWRRRLPRPFRRRAAARSLRALHGNFFVAAALSVETGSLEIQATDALTARVGESGAACRLYGSLAASLLELSGLGRLAVVHSQCQRRGEPRCIWQVEEQEV